METIMSEPLPQTTRAPEETGKAGEAGVHPIVVKIAIGAVLWFLAITWLAFAGSGGVDWDLTVVTLFFAVFFTLFLCWHPSAWPIRAGRRDKPACANS
jgi:hypothetical protein